MTVMCQYESGRYDYDYLEIFNGHTRVISSLFARF